MHNKLFDINSRDDNGIDKNLSIEEARENIEFILDKHVELTEEAIDIVIAENLLDTISVEDTSNWDMFCDETGYPKEENLSTEAIISKKEGATTLLSRLWHKVTDIGDDIMTVFNAFNGYKVEELEILLVKIKKGELVPRKNIPRVNHLKLQDKFATFFVTGNSLKNSKDLIAYMDEPVQQLLSGAYNDFMSKHWKIMWTVQPEDAQQYKSINLNFKKFKMSLKIVDEEKENILMSFLVKRFYKKLYMYTMYKPGRKVSKDEASIFDHVYDNNIDILPIPNKYLEDIKPLPQKEMIELLTYCIKSERDIKTATREAKTLFVKYGIKNYLAKAITSITAVTAISNALLAARAFNVFVTHLGNVSKDMIYYDKMIIQLVNAMYEKK